MHNAVNIVIGGGNRHSAVVVLRISVLLWSKAKSTNVVDRRLSVNTVFQK